MKAQVVGHTQPQIDHLRQVTSRSSLECTAAIEFAGDFLVELGETVQEGQTGQFAHLLGQAETLKRGGTLIRDQVKDIEHSSEEFYRAMDEIRTNIGDLTHEKPREFTLKSYNKKSKNGLAPHRDANFTGDDALIGMVSLKGIRQSGLWVVPQSIILPGTDQEHMRKANREVCLVRMMGTIGSQRLILTPFDVSTQSPGDLTLVEERASRGGVWEDPKLLKRFGSSVAVWHSVFGNFPEEPADVEPGDNYVISLITRNRSEEAAISHDNGTSQGKLALDT